MYSHRMVQKLSLCTSSRSLNDFSRKIATYYLTLLAKYKDWKNPFQKSSKFHIKGKPAHQGVSGLPSGQPAFARGHVSCRHSICGDKHAWRPK